METLMGAETEYAVAILDSKGHRQDAEETAHALMNQAIEQLPHLLSCDGQGVFLSNAGKFYIDVGCHPEYATPECTTPWDLVRYTLAGDRIMALLVAALQRTRRSSRVLAFRGNTGYGSHPESWACHESFLCRRPPAEYTEQILPFLVSRMVFAGSGGFDPHSPGIAFTLSPRSHFLTTVANTETMRGRPIMNLRDESLASEGYHRLHLICADAVGSQTATWLRAGTTALVIALIDAGFQPAREIALKDPLAALKTFAGDTTMTATVPTAQGGQVSALAIQRRYLELVRANLSSDRFPAWAAMVLEGWERMLTLLQQEQESLTTVLDWAIKRAVYTEFCAQRGVEWDSLPHWTHLVACLHQACRKAEKPVPSQLTPEKINESVPCREEIVRLSGYLQEKGLDWNDLPRFLALRAELLELDTRFLELGGIFQHLDQEGVLKHSVLSDPAAIDEAVLSPPTTSRAALRGRYVQQFAKSADHRCGWTEVVNMRSRQILSLADPFTTSADWASPSHTPIRGAGARIREILLGMEDPPDDD